MTTRVRQGFAVTSATVVLLGSISGADEDDFVDDSVAAPQEAAPNPAEALFWEAVWLLDSTDPTEQKQGQRLLREAADREFVGAQGFLGECYLYGTNGFPRQERRGVEWFRLAAEQGYTTAKAMLGICYATGSGVRSDLETALKWLREAVEEALSFQPLVPPPSFLEKQAQRAREATNAGPMATANPAPWEGLFAHATYNLAGVLESMNQSEEALRYYEAAASYGVGSRAGMHEAARKAAMYYALGRGTKRDLSKANELLERSRTLARRTALASFHAQWSSQQVDEFDLDQLEKVVSTAADQQLLLEQQNVADTLIREDPAEAVRWCEIAAENGEPWAMLKIAELKYQGVGGPVDRVAAVQWYERAAREADLELAWGNLAVCLLRGIGRPADEAAAHEIIQARRDDNFVCALAGAGRVPERNLSYASWMELLEYCAVREKLPEAQYHHALSILKEEGAGAAERRGRSRRGKEIVRLLESAAKGGVIEANFYLGQIYESDRYVPLDMMQARRYYDIGDQAGSALCAYRNGSMEAEGIGRPRNFSIAIEAYLRAIARDPDHADMRNDLAVAYEQVAKRSQGTGIREKSLAAMIEQLEAANELGSAYGAFNLGRLYYENEFSPPDYAKAYDYFQTAAERGHVQANRFLGHMHNRGQGVPETPKEALYYYRSAALGGDVEALREVCEFYLTGRGVELDLNRAASWLALLSQHGDFMALVKYGDVLLEQGEYVEARKLWTDLARSSFPLVPGYAEERLSRIYRDGLGVRPDERRAKQHFDRAVKASNPDALCRVGRSLVTEKRAAEALKTFDLARKLGSHEAAYLEGCLLISGDGVPRNVEAAWALIRGAAKRGYLEAQYNLAISTLTEIEGAPSISEAIDWAEKAEAAGHPKAGEVRRKLEAKRENTAPPVDANRSQSA